MGSFDFLVGTTGSITRPLDEGTCNLEPRTGSSSAANARGALDEVVLIRGVVRGRDGRPVDSAVVWFLSAPVDVPDIAAVTGDDGNFVVSAPSPGHYRLGVRADGHSLREVPLEVDDDVDLSVDLIPEEPDTKEELR